MEIQASNAAHSYDFEYEDEDDDQGGDVDIENKYYNAKQLKGDNPAEAVDEFLGIPGLEPEKGEWCVISQMVIVPAMLIYAHTGDSKV